MNVFTNWNDQQAIEVFPGDWVWSATGDQLQVIRARMEPGTDFGIHQHAQEQIICVLEGELEFTVGSETQRVGPGQVIHAPSGVNHGGKVVSSKAAVTIEAFSPPRADFEQAHQMDFRRPE